MQKSMAKYFSSIMDRNVCYWLAAILAPLLTTVAGIQPLDVSGCLSTRMLNARMQNITESGRDITELLKQLCLCDPSEDDPSTIEIHCLFGSSLGDLRKSLKAVSDADIPLKSIYLDSVNFFDAETPTDTEVFRGGIFTEFKAKPERFVLSSNYKSLTFTDDAFVGLEDRLKTLVIKDSVLKGNKIPSAVKRLRSLETLNITGCGLERVLTGDLTGLENLRQLNLAENHLLLLQSSAMENLTSLERLVLGPRNSLNTSTIFEAVNRIPSLKILDLRHLLHLTEIPSEAMGNLKSLQKLNFVASGVRNISKDAFVGLEALEELDMSVLLINYLDGGTFSPLTNLKELRCLGNYIENITMDTFHGLTALKRLSLSYNELKTIPADTFSFLPSLEYLDLANNEQLSQLAPGAFNGLKRLKVLRLNKTALTNINAAMFQSLTALQTLDLSSTALQSIHPKTFENNLNLTSLRLAALPLRTLEVETVRFISLTSLDLSATRWLCDDRLKPLVRHLKNTSRTFILQNEAKTTCHTPLWLRGMKLTELAVTTSTTSEHTVGSTGTTAANTWPVPTIKDVEYNNGVAENMDDDAEDNINRHVQWLRKMFSGVIKQLSELFEE